MREFESPKTTKDEHFGEELSEVVGRIHPVITSQMGNFATEHDIADVAQSTWESAWRSKENFDPEKGSLQAWVVSIARVRAIDAVNKKLADIEHKNTAERLASAGDRSDPMFAVETQDPSERVIRSLDASHEITAILRVVEDVIQNQAAIARGLSLILIFDDDIDLATRTLGISQDTLRRARRELILCCQVVGRAKQLAVQGDQMVTLRTLMECLPEVAEAGDWTRELAVAVAAAGGFEQVTIEHVMDVTGYSYSTSRQYLVQSRHLIQVAATAIHRFRMQ